MIKDYQNKAINLKKANNKCPICNCECEKKKDIDEFYYYLCGVHGIFKAYDFR